MENHLAALTQPELFALALDASRRGDSGRTLTYLKEASTRADATGQALFLLGSEYAQIGLMDDALANFERAVAVKPDLAIASFQLGLLQLTNARPDEALMAWAPLAELGADHPLAVFSQGLRHLIRDEFSECVQCLERGLELNTENPALNVDMQRIIDKIKTLPPGGDKPAVAPEEEATEEPQSHLFLNAYTGGKVH